jgi:heat shock protein HslJ
VQSNHPLQEDLALLDGLSRSDAFVAKSVAANYPPTIMASPTPSSTESFTVERKEGEQKREEPKQGSLSFKRTMNCKGRKTINPFPSREP